MLRRITALTIVCVSLLLAGLPAVACAPSMVNGDCCPPLKGLPCDMNQNDKSVATLVCCASGALDSTAIVSTGSSFSSSASIAASPDIEKHHRQSDGPAAYVFSAQSAGQLPSAVVAFSRPLSTWRPASNLLYLSTGRLRL